MAISKDEILARKKRHESSKARLWAVHGENYYSVSNDILDEGTVVGKLKENKVTKSNEKLVHSTYRNLVDEKVSFLFSKDPIITNGGMSKEEAKELEIIKEHLGKDIARKMTMLGIEASNKAIGWLQPYIDNNTLKWHVHDTKELIPVWRDKQERELEAMIQTYSVEEYNPTTKAFEITEHVAYFDDQGVQYYRMKNEGELETLTDLESYITLDGSRYTWGRVPFIPFFNNIDEIPDIKIVKTLIDAYDKGRSESQNFIEDIRSFILVLKGYDGDSLESLITNIKKYGAIALDADEGAGVDALNAEMNIADTLNHFSQLKKDIFENAQGVNRDIASIGSNPTNLTLKFLFAGLNLKADKLEMEFKNGFNQMLEFVQLYSQMNGPAVNTSNVEIEFNRDMTMNESELIKDINASADLSLQTRLEMHPFVSDPKDELNKIKNESTGNALVRPVDIELELEEEPLEPIEVEA